MPTIKEIEDSIIARFSAAYGQQVPLYANAFLRIVSKAVAGGLAVAYQFINYTKSQARIRTASNTAEMFRGAIVSPLVDWGRMIGLGDPRPATSAVVVALVTNENPGDALPAGSLLESMIGLRYTTLEDTIFYNHIGRVECECTTFGDAGNDVASGFKVVSPPNGISEDAGLEQLKTAGLDAETESAYRARVLAWWQRRALGGALADYWTWALTVPGIVKAYPTRGDAGEVDVRIQASESSSGSSEGIPTQTQIDAVSEAIEYNPNEGISLKANRRPVGSAVNVLPITMTTVDITVTGVTGVGDSGAFQIRINDHLTSYLTSLEPFILGLTPAPRKDVITGSNITAEVAKVVGDTGGQFTRATAFIAGDALYNEILNTGLAKLGTVTISYGGA